MSGHHRRSALASHQTHPLMTCGVLWIPLLVHGLAFAIATRADEPAANFTLADPSLVTGIPTAGKHLTEAEVRRYLAQPENHQELPARLPDWLEAGQALVSVPTDNPLTRAKIELGRQLFFDPRLSADHRVSCASCHDPAHDYSKPTPLAIGIGGVTLKRHSPVSFNRLFSREQNWDGRSATVEEQARFPITNPMGMGSTPESVVRTLARAPVYRLEFAAVFDRDIHFDDVLRAVAAFQRVLLTGPSPYDRREQQLAFERLHPDVIAPGKRSPPVDEKLIARHTTLRAAAAAQPMSAAAIRGQTLFFSRHLACGTCHLGINFTDERYHTLGIGQATSDPDLGRYRHTKQAADRGAFKTPTLRNIAHTAPYMHDGSLPTLEAVIDFYAAGGHPSHPKPAIKPFAISADDRSDLVEFLRALTGPLPIVETGKLPE